MEGIDKAHMGKYKEITNDWNYDASCTLTSLPVWDLENFKRLIFVVQFVPHALADLESNIFQQLWQGVDQKIEVRFPRQMIGKNMWADEEIAQQPAPHTERKVLLMRSDRRRTRIFLFPHVHVVALKIPSCVNVA
jgi:hypothetical protein